MPASVSFNITAAPLPLDFEGSLQEFADTLVERLSISPAQPWSSFQNGGSIPTSDVGPILLGGTEWRVFDTTIGAYTYHKQNGAGLVDATVTLAKLANGTAKSIFTYDAAGRPALIAPTAGSVLVADANGLAQVTAASGISGQVLTLVGTTPDWVDSFAPTGTYFEVTLSGDQDLNTDGTFQVDFDTVRTQANVVFDTVGQKVPVVAGQVWFFYVDLELEDAGTIPTPPVTGSFAALAVSNPPTQAEMQALRNKCEVLLAAYNNTAEISVYIRIDGVTTGPQSVLDVNFTTAVSRQGTRTCGVVNVVSDGFVDVAIVVAETTPESPGMKVPGNLNTRFGGVRII